MLVNYFAIYPNFLLTLHPDYMMTITIWPQDCGRTKLIAEWHFHPDEMAKPDFVFAGRDRVLGSDESRGLGDLRAVVSRDQLARVCAGAVLRTRETTLGI